MQGTDKCNDPLRSHKIRLKSIRELEDLLKNTAGSMNFRAYPRVGEAESFHYDSSEETVTRHSDGKNFDNLDDFVCYCFQCDPEGYSHTEHIDVEILGS